MPPGNLPTRSTPVSPTRPDAPLPEAPSTPGGTTTFPGSPSQKPGAPTGGTAATPQSLLQAADKSEWWHWWEYHRELYLDLDQTLSRLHPRTPSDDPSAELEGRRFGLSTAAVYGRIVPAIHVALRDGSDDARVLRQGLLALGRIGEAPSGIEAPSLLATIRPYLADGNLGVVEGATIALGALASPEAVVTLRSLLLDDEQGREFVGGKVSVRVRALAAYGLG
ncbi:MAG: HEAT repeat domain-containing protein, partial [Planctomycetota bacterium]|nr:HEAT repeat domain-containing protein [Planctomycetota bacterium]